MESQVSQAQFELRSNIGILRCVGQTNLNMADVASVDEEIKQDEIAASVNPETDEASEETPNGVKTWVKIIYCFARPAFVAVS